MYAPAQPDNPYLIRNPLEEGIVMAVDTLQLSPEFGIRGVSQGQLPFSSPSSHPTLPTHLFTPFTALFISGSV